MSALQLPADNHGPIDGPGRAKSNGRVTTPFAFFYERRSPGYWQEIDQLHTATDTRRWFRRLFLAMVVSLLLALAGHASSCTFTVQAPIVINKSRPGHPDTVRMIWDDGTNISSSGCPVSSKHSLDMTLVGPALRWVSDVDFTAYPIQGRLPLYEVGPDSALLGFVASDGDSSYWPLRLGPNRFPGVPGNTNFIVIAYVYSRGERMRDFQTTLDLEFSSVDHSTISASLPISIDMQFPPTTCPVRDVAEVLQDVSVAELIAPGDTAKDKIVMVRMECGANVPRAELMLKDAGDAGNTGSLLTPTADSGAKGVRVQLLRGGSEVQFGRAWHFNPGTGGVHDHAFTARYYRTADALVPGMIKGEAVLNVDYW